MIRGPTTRGRQWPAVPWPARAFRRLSLVPLGGYDLLAKPKSKLHTGAEARQTKAILL